MAHAALGMACGLALGKHASANPLNIDPRSKSRCNNTNNLRDGQRFSGKLLAVRQKGCIFAALK